MRREKQHNGAIQENALGSPPHAQGKAFQDLRSKDYTRITPACAGKSFQVPPDRFL